MSVDREEVLRIASLARLRFEEDQLDRMTRDLNSILTHVDELMELEEEAPGTGDGRPEGASTRPDEESGQERDLDPSRVAPAWQDGFFLVPPPPGVHAEGDGA